MFGVNLSFLPPSVRRRPEPAPETGLPYGITKRRPRIDAGGLNGEIEGDAHLQDADEIRRCGERFCALLAAVSDNPYLDVRTLGAHVA